MKRLVKKSFTEYSTILLCIVNLTKKKYTGFNKYLACQALVYFKDAEGKEAGKVELIKPISWEKMKKYLEAEVRQIKRRWSPHEK